MAAMETRILNTTIVNDQASTSSAKDSRKISLPCETISNVIDIQRHGSYQRLLRITSYVFRFIHNCRNKTKMSGELSVKEIDSASKTWIRDTQQQNYPDVIENLKERSTKHPLVVVGTSGSG